MMRASLLFRLSPLLVLAAALVAFAAFLAHDGATRATAATMPSGFYVLKSDMSVGTSNTLKGYLLDNATGGLHATDANYAADSFTFHGVEYQVTRLTLTNDKTLQLVFDKAIPAHMKSALTLWVEGVSYSLSSATLSNIGGTTDDSATWANTRRNWSGGEWVGVTISSSNIWSATLTVGDLLSGLSAGCDDAETGQECSSNLTDNTFTFGGADYQIVAFAESASLESLGLQLDKTIPDSLDNLVLDVDSRSLVLAGDRKLTASNTDDFVQWTNTGISWSVGDTVQLRLTERQPPAPHVYFYDHTLVTYELGDDGLRHSEEIEVGIDPPIPSGGSNVMVQIQSRSTATRGADYGLSLPNAPGRTETKLLRLPEGASSVSFHIFGQIDRLTESIEYIFLRLVPIPDAPYRVFEDSANRRYQIVEVSVLDTSQAPSSSADAGRGIRIGPRSFTMTEGSSYSYTVRLNTAPSDDVVVTPYIRPYFSRGAPLISINPETLTFTSTNWSATQQFTVTAPQGDYSHANGTRYLITHGLTSDDTDYDTTIDFNGPGIDGTMYTVVTVNDTQSSDEAPGQPSAVALTLGKGDGAVMEKTVSESAGEVAVTVTLNAPAPYGGITFRLVPSPDDTATRDTDYTMPASINIPAGESSGSGVIKVTDDALDEADETVDIVATASHEDLVGRATLTIADDDTAGVTVTAANPLNVDEGGTATYTVVLDSQPSANVKVTPSTSDAGAATVSPASHTFTPSGWNTAKTFTVSGVADADGDDESVSISHGVTSGDAKYGAVLPAAVSVAVSETTTEQQSPQDKYASLIARIKQWRDDPCCASNKDHTDRWDKALLAFGESVADASLTPMTATEAQGYADRGWTRWVEVAAALREIESGGRDDTPNQAPTVARAIADATIVNEGGTHQVSLSGTFNDADSDSLTITAASDDEAVATVSVASDYSTLTVSAKARGTADITVTASDGNGGTVEDTFTVTVKAGPVVASAISDVSGLEAGDTQDVSLSGVFSDADNDSLTITAASSDNAVATVSVAADQSKLTLTGVAQGTATITVTARDSDGNTVSDAFDATITAPQQQDPANQAPTVSAAVADATIPNESGTHQVSLAGVFSDADSDSLTVTASSSDDTKATVSVAADYTTLTVSAKARGTADITVTASDGRGGTVSDAFTVRVKAAPVVASALSDVSGLEVFAAREISLSGVFSDADGDSLTLSASSSDEFVVDAALVEEALTIFALDQGTATITVTAQDSDGNTATDSFDVSVVGPPTPVVNLRCVAETSRVAFLWDAPEWSGGKTYAYDYQLTLPGGKSEGGRIISSTLLLRPGEYQSGGEASVSVQAVYELADGSNVSSDAETLTCTVAE